MIMAMCKIFHVRSNIFQSDSTIFESRKNFTEFSSQVFRYFNWSVSSTKQQSTLFTFRQFCSAIGIWFGYVVFMKSPPPITLFFSRFYQSHSQISHSVKPFPNGSMRRHLWYSLLFKPFSIPSIASLFFSRHLKMPETSKQLKNCVTMWSKIIS